MSIKSVMPSSHFILCRPLLRLPSIPPSIEVFSNKSTLHMRWPKYWNFSLSIILSKEILGLFVVMFPKVHLTSHSMMSGSRWLILPSWLSGLLRSFLYNSSVYSCHLFLMSYASVRSIHTISVFFCAHLYMKYSLGISNLLEEIFLSMSLLLVPYK